MRLGDWDWLFDLIYASRARPKNRRAPGQRVPPGFSGNSWGSKKRRKRRRTR